MRLNDRPRFMGVRPNQGGLEKVEIAQKIGSHGQNAEQRRDVREDQEDSKPQDRPKQAKEHCARGKEAGGPKIPDVRGKKDRQGRDQQDGAPNMVDQTDDAAPSVRR